VDRKTQTRTEVETKAVTLTRKDVRSAIAKGILSEEEERYVRMRFGIAEPGTTVLAFRGQDHAETRAALSRLEAETLAHVRATTTGNPVKDRIVARLRRQ
jgi:RNA polymerase primary sigma factor